MFQFMNSSLDQLVKNLLNLPIDELYKFRILKNRVADPELLELVTRKDVYPYDYMADSTKFKEENLQSQNEFYNRYDTFSLLQKVKINMRCNIKTLQTYGLILNTQIYGGIQHM